MINRNYSRGMGTGGWIFLIFVVGGVVTIGTKLAPLYLDHNTMSSILDGLASEQGIVDKRTDDIDDMIRKRFKMNNIRDFDFKKGMKITRPEDRVVVDLNYEVRVPLIGNVDLVAHFDHHTEMRN